MVRGDDRRTLGRIRDPSGLPAPGPGSARGVVLAIPLLFVGAASALVHGVRYLFCVGDVHPLLSSVLAFLIALFSGAENVSGAVDPGPGVELVLAWLAVGGSLVVLGLTVFEHRRLRQHGSRWSDVRRELRDLPRRDPVRR